MNMKRNILYIIALVSMVVVSACTPKEQVELAYGAGAEFDLF